MLTFLEVSGLKGPRGPHNIFKPEPANKTSADFRSRDEVHSKCALWTEWFFFHFWIVFVHGDSISIFNFNNLDETKQWNKLGFKKNVTVSVSIVTEGKTNVLFFRYKWLRNDLKGVKFAVKIDKKIDKKIYTRTVADPLGYFLRKY